MSNEWKRAITRVAHTKRSAIMCAAATAFAITAGTSQVEAADQLRIRVLNEAGFVIDKLTMKTDDIRQNGNFIGVMELDEDNTNFSKDQSQSVKWDADENFGGPRWDRVNDIYVKYKILTGDTATCSEKFSVAIKKGQITKVWLPDGSTITDTILKDKKDQIVRADLKVRGTVDNRKCSYSKQRVYNR